MRSATWGNETASTVVLWVAAGISQEWHDTVGVLLLSTVLYMYIQFQVETANPRHRRPSLVPSGRVRSSGQTRPAVTDGLGS